MARSCYKKNWTTGNNPNIGPGWRTSPSGQGVTTITFTHIPFELNPGQININIFIDYISWTGIKIFNPQLKNYPIMLMENPKGWEYLMRNYWRYPIIQDGWKQEPTHIWLIIQTEKQGILFNNAEDTKLRKLRITPWPILYIRIGSTKTPFICIIEYKSQ